MKLAAIVTFVAVFTLPTIVMVFYIIVKAIQGKEINFGQKYPTGKPNKGRNLLIVLLYLPIFFASAAWLIYAISGNLPFSLVAGLGSLGGMLAVVALNWFRKGLPQPPTEGFKNYKDRNAWQTEFNKAWHKMFFKGMKYVLLASVVFFIVFVFVLALIKADS